MHLDFHTHNSCPEPGIIKFYNVDIRKGVSEFSKGDYRHAGIHPWWCSEELLTKKESLRELFLNENFLCMGEMGLDRIRRDIDFGLQVKIFNFQLEIAQERGDEFILIHCVRAYQDILACVKESGYLGHLVFHDYNGGVDITEKLLKRGDFFSYGSSLFRGNSKAAETLSVIPVERLFFESDDRNKFTIIEAHEKASRFLKVDSELLAIQCIKNFNKLLN